MKKLFLLFFVAIGSFAVVPVQAQASWYKIVCQFEQFRFEAFLASDGPRTKVSVNNSQRQLVKRNLTIRPATDLSKEKEVYTFVFGDGLGRENLSKAVILFDINSSQGRGSLTGNVAYGETYRGICQKVQY